MNYEVYLRNDEGKRGSLVKGIVSITATFRVNEPVKWIIDGAGLAECPLADGAEIIVFREGEVLFCGYAEKKSTKYDSATHIFDWSVSGKSDIGRLDQRLINPDPAVVPPDPNGTYTATGVLSSVLLTLIDLNAGGSALANRHLPGLYISEQIPVGESETIESKLESLLKFVRDKLVDTDIVMRESWNVAAGTWDVKISLAKDVSTKVIFSVDNGTISSWERTVSAPKANYLTVTGCKNDNDETLFVRVEDLESSNKWGRIEGVVARSDIKRIVIKNDSNQITYEEPWSSVMERLETAAYEELEKATAQVGYKLTTTEINRNVFMKDYEIGNIVSVRIGSDEFKAKVDEIKIKYAEGVETITPSIGTLQKGELQTVFTELGALKDQIKVLQKSE